MPTAIASPGRITNDAGRDLEPRHAWIIGATPTKPRRGEVGGVVRTAAVGGGVFASSDSQAAAMVTAARPSAAPECCCPEFCELDHANE